MPIIKIVNAETGEEIEREMNAEELAASNLRKEAYEAEQLRIQETIAKRKALLSRLGITDEESKLLLS